MQPSSKRQALEESDSLCSELEPCMEIVPTPGTDSHEFRAAVLTAMVLLSAL